MLCDRLGIALAYKDIVFQGTQSRITLAPGREEVVGFYNTFVGRPAGELPDVGMTVCYDLRFPELFRILAVRGARLIAVPSAFTSTTGRDHWEVLLRARAIENQVFVLAPNQSGKAPPHFDSFGHSSIVDPWGTMLATAPEGECFVAADLDLSSQEEVRESLPSLANRRPEAYAWPQLAEMHA